MERKIKIPTKEELRIEQLEQEKEKLATTLEFILLEIIPSITGE